MLDDASHSQSVTNYHYLADSLRYLCEAFNFGALQLLLVCYGGLVRFA